MTKEQKNKILNELTEERDDYVKACTNRISVEQGKILGADYMLRRFIDIFRTEVEPWEGNEEE